MGIRYLNKFLRLNCRKNIKLLSLEDLSNKTIAVDISVYLYRFQSEGCIIDGMYQMITLFKHYNINLIFVFDGKPPIEKQELLKKRKKEKEKAEKKYKELEKSLRNKKNSDEISEIECEMDALRKCFIRITNTDIENVKKLIDLSGLSYYIADGESDYLCVQLVKQKKAWACLSEDMDMFVYGCPRVLRYLSLLNSKVVLYNFKGILQELRLTEQEFKEICILSGTDYNINKDKSIDLNTALILFSKYRHLQDKSQNIFYNWLLETNILNHEEIEQLKEISKMFTIDIEENKIHYVSTKEVNINSSQKELQEFLNNYDFVFV